MVPVRVPHTLHPPWITDHVSPWITDHASALSRFKSGFVFTRDRGPGSGLRSIAQQYKIKCIILDTFSVRRGAHAPRDRERAEVASPDENRPRSTSLGTGSQAGVVNSKKTRIGDHSQVGMGPISGHSMYGQVGWSFFFVMECWVIFMMLRREESGRSFMNRIRSSIFDFILRRSRCATRSLTAARLGLSSTRTD